MAAQQRTVLRCQARKRGEMWISECLELGVASCGTTLSEARDNLHEAIRLYLDEVRILRQEGKRVHVAPVPWYRARAAIWNFHFRRAARLRKNPSQASLWLNSDPAPAYG